MSRSMPCNNQHLLVQSIVLLSLLSLNESGDGNWHLEYPPWTASNTAESSTAPPLVTIPLLHAGFTSDSCGLTEYMSVRIATSHINSRDSTFCPAINLLNQTFEIAYKLEDLGTRSSFFDQKFVRRVVWSQDVAKVILAPVVHDSPHNHIQKLQLVSFLNMTETPHISWTGTNFLPPYMQRDLPYIFRMTATCAYDMHAVAQFLVFNGWTDYIITFFKSDSIVYRHQADTLEAKSPSPVFRASKIILSSVWISPSRDLPKRVTVLCASSGFSLDFFRRVKNERLFNQLGRVWIRVDTRWDVYQQGKHAVALQQFVGLMTVTHLRWDLGMSAVRQDFIKKWEERMPITNITEFTSLPTSWNPSNYGCDDVTTWAYDTMVTLALVANEISSSGRDPAKVSKKEWSDEMKRIFHGGKIPSFNCLSGEVDLGTPNGVPMRLLPIGVYNTHNASNAPQLVAWSSNKSQQIIWKIGATVIWPEGLRGGITNSKRPSHRPTGRPQLCAQGMTANPSFSSDGACIKCSRGRKEVRVKPYHPPLRQPGSNCEKCPIGRYQNNLGQTKCIQCGGGTFANVPGASSCIPCSSGHMSGVGFKECLACPVGKYQNESGQTYCRRCPDGEFTNLTGADACRLCPVGTFSNHRQMHSTMRSSCATCQHGRYNPLLGQSICLVCPKGGECTATAFTATSYYFLIGTPAMEKVKERILNNPENDRGFPSVGPYACPVPKACLGENQCRAGHEGPFCACCSKGYLRAYPWKLCGPCPPRGRNVCFIVGLWMTMLISMIILDRINHINVGNLRAVALIVLKIFCNFFIQFSVVATVTDLHNLLSDLLSKNVLWKGLLLPVMTGLGLGAALENPGLHVLSLPCLLNSLGIPLNFVYFNVVAAWITVPVVLFFSTLVILLFIAVVCISRSASVSCRICCDLIHAVSIMTLYLLHPMVTSLALSIFNCDYHDRNRLHYDTPRLLLDTRIMCSEPEYQFWKAAAYCCLVTWSLGIPSLLWCILWRLARTSSLASCDALRKYGFLYQGFEADQYYYEVVFMLRRAVYLAAAHLDWINNNCRIVLLLSLNLFFFIFHLNSRPYDDRAYARLDALDSWSYYTLVLCLLARLFQMMSEDMEGIFFQGPNGVESKPTCFSRETCDTDLDHVPGFTKLIYFPALASFFIFVLKGLYLLVRSGFWPLEDVALLPTKWAKRLDGRLHITLVPWGGKDHRIMPTISQVVPQDHHAVLGHTAPNVAKLLEGFGVGHSKRLKGTERTFFKTVFCQAIELVTKHHELCLDHAPDVISLPLLLLQLERLFVASTAVALANRIRYGALYRQRDTWGKYFFGIGQDIYRQVELMVQSPMQDDVKDQLVGTGKVIRDESRRGNSCTYLDPDTLVDHKYDLLLRPVSVEELQVAMMMLEPLMLAKAEPTEHRDILQLVVEKHGRLLDLVADVKWLFSPAGFERMRMLRTTVPSEPAVNVNGTHSGIGKRLIENTGSVDILDGPQSSELTSTTGLFDSRGRLARPLTSADIELLRYGPLRECALVQL